jgi:hypothetical protein
MNKELLILVLGILIGCAGSYTLSKRYNLIRMTNFSAYQVDNLTGRAWLLLNNNQIPLEQAKPGDFKIN